MKNLALSKKLALKLYDVIQGDSGGPLAVQEGRTWYLVGNTSWGSSTCNVRYPSAWSKNSAVYSWIQQTATSADM